MADKKNEKVVGIIGGMGPEATVDLMQRIIRLTPALDDIDHIRCVVDNNPKVPSRIKAIIEGTGVDPSPAIIDLAKRLESWGADFLVMPCNTAHHYYNQVNNGVNIPVIHLIKLVVHHICDTCPEVQHIGILASPAVIMTNLYQEICDEYGLGVIYPETGDQNDLFNIIRKIKAGQTDGELKDDFHRICDRLVEQGAEVVVIACTELGVIAEDLTASNVDATEILAQEVVDIVKNKKNMRRMFR